MKKEPPLQRDTQRPLDGEMQFTFKDLLERFSAGLLIDPIRDGPTARTDIVVSYRTLQDIVDYRLELQARFAQLDVGGHLVVVVPHAFLHERRLTLPSPWHVRQRRLYTPASLLAEVEEALVPNSYRVRWAGDLDGDYDYALAPDIRPVGESDVALVLERIALPNWSVEDRVPWSIAVPLNAPDFAFEPEHTQIEMDARPSIKRLLVLKLDHLGDLIMAVPALERLRRYFPDAKIDLVVGSWNAPLARELGVADRVIAFDAFPRNSSEEEANVPATLGQFRALITERYDLAIDLRSDIDTRGLLKTVDSPLKAAIGTRARFPFLDIALPLDSTRNEAERVRDNELHPDSFHAQGSARRSPFGVYSDRQTVERDCAIIWGPYLELDPGDYLFDFYLDLDPMRGDGLLQLDIAIDRGATVAKMIVSRPSDFHVSFRVDKPKTVFEARILTVENHPSINFGFHGGRLIKRGPGNVLHQSEYMCLLVELVKLRVQDFGMLRDVSRI